VSADLACINPGSLTHHQTLIEELSANSSTHRVLFDQCQCQLPTGSVSQSICGEPERKEGSESFVFALLERMEIRVSNLNVELSTERLGWPLLLTTASKICKA
jgi:hypothetical protein